MMTVYEVRRTIISRDGNREIAPVAYYAEFLDALDAVRDEDRRMSDPYLAAARESCAIQHVYHAVVEIEVRESDDDWRPYDLAGL